LNELDSAPSVDVAVVGAGIAGLAGALELRDAGFRVAVLESALVPGGVMGTAEIRGYRIEVGPNTVQVKGAMRAFLERHDLTGGLVPASPASRHRFLVRGGRLEPVPLGPLGLLRTPLLSTRGKLRLLREPFVPVGRPHEETVAEFLGRRLGPEAVRALAGPFLTGIYAGDERRLGAAAVFPALVEMEEEAGSLLRGALRRSRRPVGPAGLRGSFSYRGGLGGLARALASRLGEALHLGARVEEIAPRPESAGGGFELGYASPGASGRLAARALLLATPAPEAARLLEPVAPQTARALASVRYAPIVSVAVGVDPRACREPITGFGFLVPREEELSLLGCLFMSQLFAGRAPAGRELLTCMLGGERWPEAVHVPDRELARRIQADLERVLGLRDQVEVLHVHRYPRAIPQPGVGHPAAMEEAEAALGDAPVALAGSWRAGVAVADSLASGTRAAEQLASRL